MQWEWCDNLYVVFFKFNNNLGDNGNDNPECFILPKEEDKQPLTQYDYPDGSAASRQYLISNDTPDAVANAFATQMKLTKDPMVSKANLIEMSEIECESSSDEDLETLVWMQTLTNNNSGHI